MPKNNLHECPNCHEKSIVRKCYSTKKEPNLIKRVEFCINKNLACKYKLNLPTLKGDI